MKTYRYMEELRILRWWIVEGVISVSVTGVGPAQCVSCRSVRSFDAKQIVVVIVKIWIWIVFSVVYAKELHIGVDVRDSIAIFITKSYQASMIMMRWIVVDVVLGRTGLLHKVVFEGVCDQRGCAVALALARTV